MEEKDKQQSSKVFIGLCQNDEKTVEFYQSLTVSQLVVAS